MDVEIHGLFMNVAERWRHLLVVSQEVMLLNVNEESWSIYSLVTGTVFLGNEFVLVSPSSRAYLHMTTLLFLYLKSCWALKLQSISS